MASAQFFFERCITKYDQKHLSNVDASLVIEIPLTIILNETELVTMACSPDAYAELAVGYLLSEGILSRESKIKEIDIDDHTVWIKAEGVAPCPDSTGRTLNTCSGKGYKLACTAQEEMSYSGQESFKAENLLDLIRILDETSVTFKRTGGVHSAALGRGSELLIRYEDIGRHNAVDKVFGSAFLKGINVNDKCLVLSGRIASEILIKAYRNGVPLILSRSAPTLKAVELADQFGLTIVGFARGSSFNIYTHSDRISL